MNDINTNFNFGEFNKNIPSNNSNTKVDSNIKTNISNLKNNSYTHITNNRKIETININLETSTQSNNIKNNSINDIEKIQNNIKPIELSPFETITENGPVEFGNKDKIITTTTGADYNYLDITSKNNWNLFGKELLENTKKAGGTIATTSISIIEGSGKFGEALIDGITLIGTGVNSIITGVIDGIGYLAKGDEWESLTEYMWDRTQNYVKEERMKDAMDFFYEGTNTGTFLKNNSWGFDINRGISSGVGEVLGVLGISFLTAGVGGALMGTSAAAETGALVTTSNASTGGISAIMASVGGIKGFGSGTEEAWNNGATLDEGALAGAGIGLWEGLQYYVGGKINDFSPFENKIANITTRVGLDGLDGGLEGFVRPAIATIYRKGYYDETGAYISFDKNTSLVDSYLRLFEENGGLKTVVTNALMGVGISAFSEVSGLAKKYRIEDKNPNLYKSGKSSSNATRQEIIDRISKLDTITPEEKQYYSKQLKELATKFNISEDEMQLILDEKLKEIADTSEIGRRTGVSTLEKCLDSGMIKNQFETKKSSGLKSYKIRAEVEEYMNVPMDSSYSDRPIYGMLLPTDSIERTEYIKKGPGGWYGTGKNKCVIIFNKDAIIDTTSLTIGDSLNYDLNATLASNPKYKGGFIDFCNQFNSLDELKNANLTDITSITDDTYIEAQIHGSFTHEMTPSNIKEIIFSEQPSQELIEKLTEKGLSWTLIN